MTALVLIGSVLVLVAVLLAGSVGLVVAALAISAAVLIGLRARLGAAERPAARRSPQPWPLQAFPAYRRIESRLSWSTTGGERYDRTVRPLLTRLAAAMLAERRRIDIERDPAAARRLLGERAWQLIVAQRSPDAPAPSYRDIARVVDRLEEL
jgi:hypothetical protein